MMKAWTFDPWNLGKDVRYRGLKLLLVGESHYDDGDVAPSPEVMRRETVQGVEKWGKRPPRRQTFFANTFEAVTGREWSIDAPDLTAFWDQVYFYNYVQEYVGHGSRIRPTTEAWARSHEPFTAVLREIQPDALLVLGRAVWRNMADGIESPARLRSAPGEVHEHTYTYDVGAKRALAAHIRHPSSAGFKPVIWHPMAEESLDLVTAT